MQMTYRNEQNMKKFVTHINVEDSPSEQDNSSYRYQPASLLGYLSAFVSGP